MCLRQLCGSNFEWNVILHIHVFAQHPGNYSIVPWLPLHAGDSMWLTTLRAGSDTKNFCCSDPNRYSYRSRYQGGYLRPHSGERAAWKIHGNNQNQFSRLLRTETNWWRPDNSLASYWCKMQLRYFLHQWYPPSTYSIVWWCRTLLLVSCSLRHCKFCQSSWLKFLNLLWC
jgi:hypothetical protein